MPVRGRRGTSYASSSSSEPVQVRQLRRLLEELDDTSSARRHLVDEARRVASRDDVRPSVMREASQFATAAAGQHVKIEAAQFEPLFEREMGKYDVFSDSIESNARRQEELLEGVRKANEEFVKARKEDLTMKRREEALQALDLSYAKYREVTVNLEEGLRFYQDFAKLLNDLRGSCKEVLPT
jgi:programmed cell death 6-interacting protein